MTEKFWNREFVRHLEPAAVRRVQVRLIFRRFMADGRCFKLSVWAGRRIPSQFGQLKRWKPATGNDENPARNSDEVRSVQKSPAQRLQSFVVI